MRRDLAMLCPTLLGGLLVGALTVAPGCSLNPQPLPPDQAQDSGLGGISSPGTDGGGHLSGPDAGKGGGRPDAGAIPPVVDGGETTGDNGDANEGFDAGAGQSDGGNDSADGATDGTDDGSHLDAVTPDVAAPDAGAPDAADASNDANGDSAI